MALSCEPKKSSPNDEFEKRSGRVPARARVRKPPTWEGRGDGEGETEAGFVKDEFNGFVREMGSGFKAFGWDGRMLLGFGMPL